MAVEGALAVGLKQRPQPALGGGDLAGQTLAVAMGCESIPGAKQLAADIEALLPEAPLLCKPFGVAAEVAQEVSPADLVGAGSRES